MGAYVGLPSSSLENLFCLFCPVPLQGKDLITAFHPRPQACSPGWAGGGSQRLPSPGDASSPRYLPLPGSWINGSGAATPLLLDQ
jgi:hypothetical protein